VGKRASYRCQWVLVPTIVVEEEVEVVVHRYSQSRNPSMARVCNITDYVVRARPVYLSTYPEGVACLCEGRGTRSASKKACMPLQVVELVVVHKQGCVRCRSRRL
jgi:hypothetical protein